MCIEGENSIIWDIIETAPYLHLEIGSFNIPYISKIILNIISVFFYLGWGVNKMKPSLTSRTIRRSSFSININVKKSFSPRKNSPYWPHLMEIRNAPILWLTCWSLSQTFHDNFQLSEGQNSIFICSRGLWIFRGNICSPLSNSMKTSFKSERKSLDSGQFSCNRLVYNQRFNLLLQCRSVTSNRLWQIIRTGGPSLVILWKNIF